MGRRFKEEGGGNGGFENAFGTGNGGGGEGRVVELGSSGSSGGGGEGRV